MNEAIKHPGFRQANRITTRKRARRERIIQSIVIAAFFIVVGFSIGVFATLRVTGFTW